MVEDEGDENKLQQVTEVVVIPERLLGDKTTKNILTGLQYVDGINGIVLQGPGYMSRKLNIGGQTIEPSVKVGKLFIEIEKESVSVIEEIKRVCNEFLSFGYTLIVNTYKKSKYPTVSALTGRKAVKDLGILKR